MSSQSLAPVRHAQSILDGLTDYSVIAAKGTLVLRSLLEDSKDLQDMGQGMDPRSRNAFIGRAEIELKRALDVFLRPQLSQSANDKLPGDGVGVRAMMMDPGLATTPFVYGTPFAGYTGIDQLVDPFNQSSTSTGQMAFDDGFEWNDALFMDFDTS